MTISEARANVTLTKMVMAETSRKEVLFGIQILRAVGALLVVLRHAAKEVASPGDYAFDHGQFGVDIFFVISGFVIYLTGRNLQARQFLMRRIIRIVPLYWIILTITILGDWMRGKQNAYSRSNEMLSYFFIPSYDSATTIFPPLVVGWSLNFEMYFYLICAATLIFISDRAFLAIVSVVIVAGVSIGAILLPASELQAAPLILLLPITVEFLAGMWLARLHGDGHIQALVPFPLILLVAAVGVLAIVPTSEPYTYWRPLTWGLPAIAIVAATLAMEPRLASRPWRPALEVGDSSYALYLVHPIVLGIIGAGLGRLQFAVPSWFVYSIMVVASLIAGLLLHRTVERPILKLIRSFSSGDRSFK